MKKKLKKYGNTLVISFNREDTEIYKLKVGDVLEIPEECLIQKIKKGENKK